MNDAIAAMARTDTAAERLKAGTKLMPQLRVVQPEDLPAHRERFLDAWRRGRPRNPVFAYQKAPDQGVPLVVAALAEAAAAQDPWHQLLADEAERALDSYRACATHQAGAITEATLGQHGRPDAALLAAATELLGEPPADPAPGGPLSDALQASEAAYVLSTILRQYGLDDWTVEIRRGMAAQMSVQGDHNRVNIRADALLSEKQLVRLCVHEVGTHVFRTVNARRGPGILQLRLTGSTATEEGLAVWHEQRLGGTDTVDRRFALRVVAVHRALTGGFVEVVEELLRFTDLTTAFDITARVKRGLVDTGEPGGYCKDHVYLAGFLQVREHLGQHPEDYLPLMSSKWPLSRLGLARDAGLPDSLPGPLHLPDAEMATAVIRSRSQGRVPPH
jgi:hypothetical protein